MVLRFCMCGNTRAARSDPGWRGVAAGSTLTRAIRRGVAPGAPSAAGLRVHHRFVHARIADAIEALEKYSFSSRFMLSAPRQERQKSISMQANCISNRRTNHPLLFLQEFLRHPRQVASIVPSSRFVERRIVELADIGSARTIIELGAGSGGTTQAILGAMPARARLLAIEINPRFCDLLRRIDDARLVVHCGAAHELRHALVRYGFAGPDAVISGVPFSTNPRPEASSIIDMIWAVLAPGGCFVAYQMRTMVDQLSRRRFGPPYVEFALLNMPPLRVYRWRKRNGLRSVGADDSRRTSAEDNLP
jgi:phosphatidylethanolamine/phosphatidyl-N-methylethanolamine N-methyltransferase